MKLFILVPSFCLQKGENEMKKKMIYRIKFVVNEYRQDKRTGPINPIPRSKYLQKLFKEEEERLK